MKMLTRLLGLVSLMIAIPVFATSASAAEYRQPGQTIHPLNGAMSPAPTGLFARTSEPEKIVVAGRRGRLGAAIVGGVIAGALIAGAARARDDRYYYSRRRYANRCDRWLWKCDRGHDWSCRNFYRYCD